MKRKAGSMSSSTGTAAKMKMGPASKKARQGLHQKRLSPNRLGTKREQIFEGKGKKKTGTICYFASYDYTRKTDLAEFAILQQRVGEENRSGAGSMSSSTGTAAKMKMGSASKQEEGLPIDIIYLILLLLPVKTLSRFRCVCKSWSSLISSPLFQQDHDRRSAGERPFLLLVQDSTPTIHLSTYSPNQTTPINNFLTAIPRTCSFPIQSCCGLLCLPSRDNIFLCNPSTQEVMPLPPPPPTPIRGRVFRPCFGFGYAASTREFKVVRFFRDYVRGQPIDRRVTHCEVFTLGTTMWRKASRPPFAPNYPAAPFLNGAVHLLPYIYQPNKAIAAFNLETEKYNYIHLPEYYGELASSDGLESKSLSELGGYLCLTLDFVTKVDLWLLKDYDNGEWTKQYTIGTLQLVDLSSPRIYATRALLIMGDGNMLINLTRQDLITELVCYDPQSHTVTQRIGTNCLVKFYIESFFSLQTWQLM